MEWILIFKDCTTRVIDADDKFAQLTSTGIILTIDDKPVTFDNVIGIRPKVMVETQLTYS